MVVRADARGCVLRAAGLAVARARPPASVSPAAGTPLLFCRRGCRCPPCALMWGPLPQVRPGEHPLRRLRRRLRFREGRGPVQEVRLQRVQHRHDRAHPDRRVLRPVLHGVQQREVCAGPAPLRAWPAPQVVGRQGDVVGVHPQKWSRVAGRCAPLRNNSCRQPPQGNRHPPRGNCQPTQCNWQPLRDDCQPWWGICTANRPRATAHHRAQK